LTFERFCLLDRDSVIIRDIEEFAFDSRWNCTLGELFDYANSELFKVDCTVASNFSNFLEALIHCIEDCKEKNSLDTKPSANIQ